MPARDDGLVVNPAIDVGSNVDVGAGPVRRLTCMGRELPKMFWPGSVFYTP